MMRSRLIVFLLALCVSCGASGPSKPAADAATGSGATGTAADAATTTSAGSVARPTFLTAKIVAQYPHSSDAYTQGLLWHDGHLYESLGEYGHSAIRRVDLATGKLELEKLNSAQHFGEGLALIGSQLYQLTWQQGEAFAYDVATFKKRATFKYSGEGWGLTSFDDELYMSDGSSTIRILSPSNFKVLRTIDVRDDNGPVPMLNELEWIEGRLWANIYMSPLVAIIDPHTGIVESYVDCTPLIRAIGNIAHADVLNGIAYDPATKRIFMTGKLYDTLFQITI